MELKGLNFDNLIDNVTKKSRLNFSVFLSLEINKLSWNICFHRSRGIESLQMNDFTTNISFYTDAISY